jgi:hypothetical protein
MQRRSAGVQDTVPDSALHQRFLPRRINASAQFVLTQFASAVIDSAMKALSK